MRECQNCGSHVTESYARVATRRDEDGVECCPFCPDRIRDGAEIRDTRSQRVTKANGRKEPTNSNVYHGRDA